MKSKKFNLNQEKPKKSTHREVNFTYSNGNKHQSSVKTKQDFCTVIYCNFSVFNPLVNLNHKIQFSFQYIPHKVSFKFQTWVSQWLWAQKLNTCSLIPIHSKDIKQDTSKLPWFIVKTCKWESLLSNSCGPGRLWLLF